MPKPEVHLRIKRAQQSGKESWCPRLHTRSRKTPLKEPPAPHVDRGWCGPATPGKGNPKAEVGAGKWLEPQSQQLNWSSLKGHWRVMLLIQKENTHEASGHTVL